MTSLPKTCLIFVFTPGRDEIVVINKRRKMGAGKLCFPGGKINHGESLEAGALRELSEETGIENVESLKSRGTIEFIFESDNGVSLNWSNQCFLYEAIVSKEYRDTFTLSSKDFEECSPFWAQFDALPWEQFWPDDRNWVPKIKMGVSVFRRIIFNPDGSVKKTEETIMV